MHQTTLHTLRRWISSGNGGPGGTVGRENPVALRERVGRNSRYAASTSAVCSIGHSVGPPTTSETACAWNVNSVTTPKLPPPPRSAQNRSGVLVGARGHLLPVREHDLSSQQVVDREAVATRQVSDAAAESQPADARRGDDPAGHRQSVVGGHVDLAPGAPPPTLTVRAGRPIPPQRARGRRPPVVDAAEPAAVVAASSDRRAGTSVRLAQTRSPGRRRRREAQRAMSAGACRSSR